MACSTAARLSGSTSNETRPPRLSEASGGQASCGARARKVQPRPAPWPCRLWPEAWNLWVLGRPCSVHRRYWVMEQGTPAADGDRGRGPFMGEGGIMGRGPGGLL